MMILKPLIIYYTKTGTTAKIAEIILPTLKAESRRLVEPKDWRNMLQHKRYSQQDDDVKVPITTLDEFDPIILLTPVWEGRPTLAMMDFLEKINLKGKRVVLGLVGADETNPEVVEKLRRKAEMRGCNFIETIYLRGVITGPDWIDLGEEDYVKEAANLVEKVIAISEFTR